MISESLVNEDVKELVNAIIARKKIKAVSSIKYHAGSEAGDGYISRPLAVDIINGKGTFRIFLKCALNIKSTEAMPIAELYRNEAYFYEVIRPAYLEFCKTRGAEDALRNIPICYGTSANIVALENLNERHFAMCDRTKCMNNAHIELVLTAFAQFHAISYAFKDQEQEKYQKLLENIYDYFSVNTETNTIINIYRNTVNAFMSKLDPVREKDILQECNGALEKLISSIVSPNKTLNEYSVLTQGDCHCNNMMFRYEEENKENPCDIMLIDWQGPRPASPVFDLSYLFYSVASKKALDNHKYYLRFYHNELCKRIRLLGSDPEILYPFEILETEWKQHCKYGLVTSFNIIRVMLSSGDEIFDVEKFDFENAEISTEPIIPKLKMEDEYHKRMKLILEHMIKNNFLE